MIKANLIAGRVAIDACTQMIALIGDTDPTTKRLIEDILSIEQEHADELKIGSLSNNFSHLSR
jgi:bacterioferritin